MIGSLLSSYKSQKEQTKRESYVGKALVIRKAYERQSAIALFLHITLQFITLLGATSVPFILNISEIDKHVPIIISGIVAIAAAISAFGRLGQLARNLNIASAAIRREMELFDLNDETYKKLSEEEALLHFVKQIERIRNQELQDVVFSSVYDNVSTGSEKKGSNQPVT